MDSTSKTQKKFSVDLRRGESYESRYILSSETDNKFLFEILDVTQGYVSHSVSIRAGKHDKSGIVKEFLVRSLGEGQNAVVSRVPSKEEFEKEGGTIWMVVCISNPYWTLAKVQYRGAILSEKDVEGSEKHKEQWLKDIQKTQMTDQLAECVSELAGLEKWQQQNLVAYLRLDGKHNTMLANSVGKLNGDLLKEYVNVASDEGATSGKYAGATAASLAAFYGLSACAWPILIAGVPLSCLFGYFTGKWAGAKAGGFSGRRARDYSEAQLSGSNAGLLAGAAAGIAVGSAVGYTLSVISFDVVNRFLEYVVKYVRSLWSSIINFTKLNKDSRNAILKKVEMVLDHINVPKAVASSLVSVVVILSDIAEDIRNGCKEATTKESEGKEAEGSQGKLPSAPC